jgi:hypothetical protein
MVNATNTWESRLGKGRPVAAALTPARDLDLCLVLFCDCIEGHAPAADALSLLDELAARKKVEGLNREANDGGTSLGKTLS